MQKLRDQQIQEVFAYFPETKLITQTPEKTEYRLPIKLSVSKSPLFIRM